jgi:hypothetical protein
VAGLVRSDGLSGIQMRALTLPNSSLRGEGVPGLLALNAGAKTPISSSLGSESYPVIMLGLLVKTGFYSGEMIGGRRRMPAVRTRWRSIVVASGRVASSTITLSRKSTRPATSPPGSRMRSIERRRARH